MNNKADDSFFSDHERKIVQEAITAVKEGKWINPRKLRSGDRNALKLGEEFQEKFLEFLVFSATSGLLSTWGAVRIASIVLGARFAIGRVKRSLELFWEVELQEERHSVDAELMFYFVNGVPEWASELNESARQLRANVLDELRSAVSDRVEYLVRGRSGQKADGKGLLHFIRDLDSKLHLLKADLTRIERLILDFHPEDQDGLKSLLAEREKLGSEINGVDLVLQEAIAEKSAMVAPLFSVACQIVRDFRLAAAKEEDASTLGRMKFAPPSLATREVVVEESMSLMAGRRYDEASRFDGATRKALIAVAGSLTPSSSSVR